MTEESSKANQIRTHMMQVAQQAYGEHRATELRELIKDVATAAARVEQEEFDFADPAPKQKHQKGSE